ncbi:hypothetical protein HMPREF0580_1126 [Mobiluncus mulieris ATCC 35239]|uniref:Cell wall binding repeat 2 n=2 Tax=Mobiluncus mulieris TaxID=2052 RepID=E0QQG1_9ACTO|nr:cell wall-binding repeat-containing protein [Mobiluncus mulieris]EFM46196.1 hypothetical protein HMPREF0580_1126 [Mobiluncus mulieris ATCC 35239]MCU9972249.1 cell wall-binding repeat-containing protein [Mobiluncus mulieris]MCU9976678.1 cell wall-binding repeat-containing protein [Mobiluncus mulieris]MCU9995235.1 cell wall-binding repeat-containing protein [Mobiluncus mulieris]MCV0015011.1 cell wall-binding repeat-containing protein [Mobiluncus mulieris]
MKTATIAAAATTALLAFTPALSWATDTTSNQYPGGITQRIAGKNRIATNYQLIKQKYGNQPVGHAYIARADLGADALSAAPLATKDPILLVDPNQAPIDTINQQIKPLGVTEVTVIGGNQAMPQQYVDTLGVKTRERLAGKDRYETNLTVIKKAYPTPQTIFVVNGDGMVDTIAATATAMTQYGPLMLASGKGYTANQEAYIESNKNCTVTSIGNAPTYPTRNHRISQIGYSQTPEQVSALVAKQTYPSGNNKFYLANSTVLADAISAGIIKDGPVLLVNPAKHPTEALLAAKDLKATHITALGGETAIPQKLLDLFSAMKPKQPGKTQPGKQTNTFAPWQQRQMNGEPNPLEEIRKYQAKSPQAADNPDWETTDTHQKIFDLSIQDKWGMGAGYGGPYIDTPIHDPALDTAAKTGTGTSGMSIVTWDRAEAYLPLHFNCDATAHGTAEPPIAASISPGHLAITAKGIYKVTKVTYGRHIEPYTDMSTGTHPTRNVYLRATLVVKIEGQPVDGGPEQQIDASGITEVEVDTGRRVGYDSSIQCKKLGEKNWWS